MITFQAEDEIAAVTSAIGAAYTGALGITTTSGPGMSLKTEALGLAVPSSSRSLSVTSSAAAPQRAFQQKPSKPISYKRSSAEIPKLRFLFWRLLRLAIVSGSRSKPAVSPLSTWSPSSFSLTAISPTAPSPGKFQTLRATGNSGTFLTNTEDFHPYLRNPTTLARPWAIPCTPFL